MEQKERSKLLRDYVSRVAPDMFDNVPDIIQRRRNLNVPEETIRAGIDKLYVGKELTRVQSISLEAVIHEQYRPAQLIVENTFSALPFPWEGLGGVEIRERIEAGILQVGRVEIPQRAGSAQYAGTAFRVGTDLIMTNRHVAEIFTRGVGQQNLNFRTSWSAGINLRKEIVPTPEVQDLNVTEIVMMHPYWDMALLRVGGLPDSESLTLSTQHPDDLIGKNVVVLGYPAFDPFNDIDLQNQIFGGMYGVKRLQPGKIYPRRLIDSYNKDVNALVHDASTLGGNSGSLVLDVDTGEIIGLHFGGLYMDANFAVPTYELARDSRVVDTGIEFSNKIKPTSEWDSNWSIADSAIVPSGDMMETEYEQTAKPQISDKTQSLINGKTTTLSTNIPLKITISLGELGSDNFNADVSFPNSPEEGWFGRSESVDDVMKAAKLFASQKHIGKSRINHKAGLTCAYLSQLAYSRASTKTERTIQRLGFDSCEFIDDADTQCFVASNERVVVVSFRGSEQIIGDWLGNFKMYLVNRPYGSVHSGFLQAFFDAKNNIQQELNRTNARGKKLVLTGHSLGGALSLIAAAEWRTQFPVSEIYTYGQPAVGGRSFNTKMRYLANHYARYVYKNDIVTKIPPFYKHLKYETKLPLSLTEITQESYLKDDEMLTEIEFQSLQEQLNNPSMEEFIFDPVIDHRMTNYVKALTKIAST